MLIESLCELKIVYESILDYFIDSGSGELRTVGTHPALSYFISSYNELGSLISYWKDNCTKIN